MFAVTSFDVTVSATGVRRSTIVSQVMTTFVVPAATSSSSAGSSSVAAWKFHPPEPSLSGNSPAVLETPL